MSSRLGFAVLFAGCGLGPADGVVEQQSTSDAAKKLKPLLQVNSDVAGSYFGKQVFAGDLNGDGYDDIVVNAPGTEPLVPPAVYAFHGSSAGLDAVPAWQDPTAFPDTGILDLRITVADVNGDAFDDLIVGQFSWDDGDVLDVGAVFQFLGSATGLESIPTRIDKGPEEDAWFGAEVASAGDVNGDGFGDVLVGTYTLDNKGLSGAGAAFLYLGSPEGLETSPAWVRRGTKENAHIGRDVAGAGDVNGDGFDDVLVALDFQALLFHGSATGLSDNPAWDAPVGFGSEHVGTLGDVTDDGYDDVWMTFGHVFSFAGSADGLEKKPLLKLTQGVPVAPRAGAAGDLDGDGFADLFVSDPGRDNGVADDIGSVTIAFGPVTDAGVDSKVTVTFPQMESLFGSGVAFADLDGDGAREMVVGAPRLDIVDDSTGEKRELGAVFVFPIER